ncbi:MAG: AbrB/MazE/SpoVT family DNA-binding domain-containing protein [Candidatus Ranarchaeia archaeon]
MAESRVGSKGELFPPKKIRDKLGLHPKVKVIYKVEDGRLIVEPIPNLEHVLEEKTAITISLNEARQHRRKLSEAAES